MRKYYFTIAAAISTLMMIWVMAKTGAPLNKIPSTGFGILNLELATGAEATQKIVNAWEKNGLIHTAEINTWWDFVFLLCYSSLFFALCNAIAGRFSNSSLFRKIGVALSYAAFAAAALDVLENLGMLRSLAGRVSSLNTALTFYSSILKWGIVALCVLYILVALIPSLKQQRP